jgi:NADH dehydrogenase
MDSEKHHVVIVGGGAAGLDLATSLGNKLGKKGLADITLFDASRTHIWKPLLHEVAAGTLDSAEDELEYLAQASWKHFRYRLGRMVGLDRERQEVRVAATYSVCFLAVYTLLENCGIAPIIAHYRLWRVLQ